MPILWSIPRKHTLAFSLTYFNRVTTTYTYDALNRLPEALVA